MRRLLILTTLLAACSPALIDKMSSFPYHDSGTEPTTSEHPVGVPNHFGVEKRFYVHNPLDYGVEVKLSCRSMFNDDPTLYVKPHTSKFIMITGKQQAPSCVISTYTVADADPSTAR